MKELLLPGGKGIQCVVDATKNLLLNALEYHPFLIKPNNHELGEIFGVTIEKREEVEPYAGKLQEMGARNVLVSMAGEGAVLLDEKNGGGFGVCQCVFRGSGRERSNSEIISEVVNLML